MEYATSLFKKDTINSFADLYCKILDEIIKDKEILIKNILNTREESNELNVPLNYEFEF